MTPQDLSELVVQHCNAAADEFRIMFATLSSQCVSLFETVEGVSLTEVERNIRNCTLDSEKINLLINKNFVYHTEEGSRIKSDSYKILQSVTIRRSGSRAKVYQIFMRFDVYINSNFYFRFDSTYENRKMRHQRVSDLPSSFICLNDKDYVSKTLQKLNNRMSGLEKQKKNLQVSIDAYSKHLSAL